MKYVRLGKTELQVSRLGLGGLTYEPPVWRGEMAIKEETVSPLVRSAIDHGVNFFDASGLNEEFIGRALRVHAKRREFVVATKLSLGATNAANDNGFSRGRILKAIDESLKRLQMEYIDLCQICDVSRLTPMDETLEALSEVVRAGKVRHIGAASHYEPFSEMLNISRAQGYAEFVSIQNSCDFVFSEDQRELMDLCAAEQIAVIPRSPITRESLGGFGFYHKAAQLLDVAREVGAKPTVVALAWVLSKPFVTAPMISASGPHAFEDAVAALSLELDAEIIAKLESPYRPDA